MSDTNDNVVNEIVREINKRDDENRRALKILLDLQKEKANHVFALRANMGITESYISSVPLEWVNNNVGFAADMPLFENHSDEHTKTIKVNSDTVELIQQRLPAWERQLPMSFYLATKENHKFPPILLVCYQNWTYDKDNDNWGIDGRAIKSSVPVANLDSGGAYWDMDVADTRYYALDGQHRVMAIMGLDELIKKKTLPQLDKFAKPKKSGEVTIADVIDTICNGQRQRGLSPNRVAIEAEVQGRMKEQIGVEIIPAVQKGETQEEAVSRLRQIFVDVNEKAKPLTKGETTQLDNDRGTRIVARGVMVSHELLNNGKTEIRASQLNENAESYTTLETLVKIAENYLLQLPEFSPWKEPIMNRREFGFFPPSSEEIASAKKKMETYFDELCELPSHRKFLDAPKTERYLLRVAESKDKDGKDMAGEDNILFRPIAQMALSAAAGQIEADTENPRTVKNFVKSIAEQEKKGQLRLTDPRSPWFGVLCDTLDRRIRRQEKYKTLCSEMFIHLLVGLPEEKREDLRKEFANARKTSDEKGYNLEGNEVSLKDIKLPKPWMR